MRYMRQNHFTRPTIAAAVGLIDARMSQAKFDHLVLRLGLEQSIPSDTTMSVSKKAALVGRLVMSDGTQLVQTVDVPERVNDFAAPFVMNLLRK